MKTQTITRKEAKINKLSRYFTGIPCKHDHIAERFTSNCECVTCHDIRKGYIKAEPVIETPKKAYRVVEFAKPSQFGRRKATVTREYTIYR